MQNQEIPNIILPIRQNAEREGSNNLAGHKRVPRRKHNRSWAIVETSNQRSGKRVGGGAWVGKSGNFGLRERESRNRDLHSGNVHGGFAGHEERKMLTMAMTASRNAWLEHVKLDRFHEVQARNIPKLFRSSAKLLFLSNLRTSTAENVQLFAMLPRELVYMILDFAKPRLFFMINGQTNIVSEWDDDQDAVDYALLQYYNSTARWDRIEKLEQSNQWVSNKLMDCFHEIIDPDVLDRH